MKEKRSQVFENEGEKPISKKLNAIQRRHTATEKETLVVAKTIQHFVVNLMGKTFKLYMDHTALTKLKNMENKKSRLMRWSLALQMFNFEVVYKKK